MMKYHAIAKMQKYAKYAKLFINEERNSPAAQLNPKCRAFHRFTSSSTSDRFSGRIKEQVRRGV